MKANRIPLFLALGFITGAANAEPETPGVRRPPPQPLLAALDASRDGRLSPDEIANSSSALAELDRNGDGSLTGEELLPRQPKPGVGVPPEIRPKRPSPLMKALDLDKDGTLSADEIEDAPLSLATLDKNEDGTLSPRELNPGKPPIKLDA